MGLIEKLEQIKTLVESGAGGGSSELEVPTWASAFYAGGLLSQNNFELIKRVKPQIDSMRMSFYIAGSTCEDNIELDFSDCDFTNCSDFYRTFWANSLQNALTCSIKNINLSNATNVDTTFAYNYSTSYLSFAGSFGGNSTTSTLTLDLSGCTMLTSDNIKEIITGFEPNASGKTRTIKLKNTQYDYLTEDDILIATNNGYTISY